MAKTIAQDMAEMMAAWNLLMAHAHSQGLAGEQAYQFAAAAMRKALGVAQ